MESEDERQLRSLLCSRSITVLPFTGPFPGLLKIGNTLTEVRLRAFNIHPSGLMNPFVYLPNLVPASIPPTWKLRAMDERKSFFHRGRNQTGNCNGRFMVLADGNKVSCFFFLVSDGKRVNKNYLLDRSSIAARTRALLISYHLN